MLIGGRHSSFYSIAATQAPLSESQPSSLEKFANENKSATPAADSRDADTHKIGPRGKVTKPRLRCNHPGCSQTFPRNFELNRHQDNVHQRRGIYLCPVFGCKRADDPLPRADKLREHYRKEHQDATDTDQFLCFFKDCRDGPFTRAELKDHLNQQQRRQSHREPYLEIILKALVAFGWHQTPIGYGNYHIDDSDACPLSFWGCAYRALDSPNTWRAHLEKHDLIDRSRGYLATRRHKSSIWIERGEVMCSICDWTRKTSIEPFLDHLQTHSELEKFARMTTLSETLSPWLTGIEWTLHPVIRDLRVQLSDNDRAKMQSIIEKVTYNNSGI